MLTAYVLRGVKAGTAAGLAFGAFVALVGNPLVERAETFEAGGHGGGPVVSGVVTGAVSVVGGVLLGILLGAVVFGVAFYFLEPAIPGTGGTKSYLLGAAGFVTVSGAPWLVLPPQPPGVEQALPVGVRLTWYVGMMVAGAVACGLSGFAYNRVLAGRGRPTAVVAGLVPFALLVALAALGPANPASGPVPEGTADAFRAVTVAGQVGLWLVLAGVHAWLGKRETDDESAGDAGRTADEASGPSPSG